MNKKLYILLLFSFCTSFMVNSMEDIKDASVGKKLVAPLSTIRSSASAFSLCSPEECVAGRSSVDLDRFSPAIVRTSAAAGVSPEQYGLQAATFGKRTLVQALAEQHAAQDAKKAAPRLAFAKKVKASKLIAKKAARDARDSEEAIAAAQKEIVGCPVS